MPARAASSAAIRRARQAKRELQLEIRQLRSFQKTEEAELKREEKIEKGLEKSGRARTRRQAPRKGRPPRADGRDPALVPSIGTDVERGRL